MVGKADTLTFNFQFSTFNCSTPLLREMIVYRPKRRRRNAFPSGEGGTA